jgi:SAM-dependent methyltransferase
MDKSLIFEGEMMVALSASLKEDESTKPFPLVLGRAEDFARVETLLRRAGFDEVNICRILKIDSMSGLSSESASNTNLEEADSELLALLIRIFLFTEPVPIKQVEKLIDQETLCSFIALDILRAGKFVDEDGGSLLCFFTPVFLYPVSGMIIASDRHDDPGGQSFSPPPDIVYPAITGGTLLFLRAISKSPASDVLDLGSGTGIAAFLLSKTADRAVASDITDRATHFAKFNALLNRLTNVEALQGDLYSSVEGRMFDRIVTHPPYVPSLSDATIFRAGGRTGEELIRRIIEELPKYLRPGGTFYSINIGIDTKEGRFEERVREWLGDLNSEFDIIFATGEERNPRQFIRDLVYRRGGEVSELDQWKQIFESIGAVNMVYGALVIRRFSEEERARAEAKVPLTLRTSLRNDTEGSCFERVFRWHSWRSRPEASEELYNKRPRLAPTLQLNISHIVENGTMTPHEFILKTDIPFSVSTKIDPVILSAMIDMDGSRSVKEIFETRRGAGKLPEAIGLEEFNDLVSTLIERGYLEINNI